MNTRFVYNELVKGENNLAVDNDTPEVDAIQQAMHDYNCTQQSMVLSEDDLKEQRKQILAIAGICDRYAGENNQLILTKMNL